MANVKKVFRKCPSRVQIFKTEAPNLPLPPEPIVTRWGTWISAIFYYCTNFEIIKRIVEPFNENDATAIKRAQEIFNLQTLEANLIYIYHQTSIVYHW